MEEWSRLCLDADVEQLILQRLEEGGLSAHMSSAVRREVERAAVRNGDVERTVHSSVATLGLDIKLKNVVYLELMRLAVEGVPRPRPLPLPSSHGKEPLDFLREAQESWEAKLRRGVNSLCTELGVPLARERTQQERDLLRRKWNSIGADYPALGGLHPVFSPKDFLEELVRLRSPNFNYEVPRDASSCNECWGLVQLQLNPKSVFELWQQFSRLHPSVMQTEGALTGSSEADYHEKSTKVLHVGLFPLARQLCKTGCPVGCRRQLWSLALGVDTELPEHAFHFEKLKSSILKYSLLFERLLIKDVKKTAANDDSYFVFEDTMHQVLLGFLHDSSLLRHFQHLSSTPFKAYIKGNVGVPQFEAVYPPNGVIPFHGFSMYDFYRAAMEKRWLRDKVLVGGLGTRLYVAPLCFLFDRSDHLYALFKEMYMRYFVYLHCISSNHQGILNLCCLFESLLWSKQPELFQHLKKINANPLRLAFGWLMSAFSGHLDSRELLFLWDRIIGFDSLEIVAVLAVAVFEFRATNLFKATSFAEAESILSDLKCLKVLPLLQQALFL